MATVAPVYEERGMSIGRIFQRMFSTITHNPLVVLGLALVLGGLPSLLFSYVTRSVMGVTAVSLANGNLREFYGATAFSWVVGVIIGAIVQGALTRATVAENEGHKASFSDCIVAGLRVFLPLVAVGLIFGLAVGLGFVLLIIPGVFIMIAWSVAAPVVVVERGGVFGALGRSFELTSGYRWKILGLFLVLLVIYFIIFAVLGIIGLKTLGGAAAAGQFGTIQIISNIVSAMVLNLLWGTIQPSLYIELRQAKEGDSVGNLEQVFA